MNKSSLVKSIKNEEIEDTSIIGNFEISNISMTGDSCSEINYNTSKVFENSKIEDYFRKGLIDITNHFKYDLRHLSYSRDTHIKGNWNDFTINCRGTVVDKDGNIIAKPYKKFFNIGQRGKIDYPKFPIKVYEKLDGSLIILFHYQGEWIFASSGSFTSEHALYAKEIFDSKYYHLYEELNKNLTYMLELIGPKYQIVVKYDQNDLVFTGHTNLSNMIETTSNDYKGLRGLQRPLYFGEKTEDDLKRLSEEDKSNFEGYVIIDAEGKKFKVKLEEYLKLHKLREYNEKTIWQFLSDGKNIEDYIKDLNVPDEFYLWCKETSSELEGRFKEIENRHLEKYEEIKDIENQKEYALKIQEFKEYNKSILFSLRSRKDYSEIIWKMIKPKLG